VGRFGFFCFVGTGHLNPAIALGRQLAARGHEVTVFHTPMARAAIRASGLKFCPLGELENGDTPLLPSRLSRGRGRVSIISRSIDSFEAVKANAKRVLREAPAAIQTSKVDCLIVDQADLAAGSVADFLGLPFVTLCTAPPLYLDDCVPPSHFSWAYRTGSISRLRNRIGNALISWLVAPTIEMVNEKRREWSLPEIHHFNDVFSKLAVITQLPEAFEFRRTTRPANLFYTGLLHDREGLRKTEFPWNRLDGRPLIYASIGTVINDLSWVFRTIAEACSTLNVQLVISLGGGALCPENVLPLAGDPLVIHYAPQLDLLRHAALTITHAGMNTTLESLCLGVPLVAIPISNDQLGVAARIRWTGAGTVVPIQRLTVDGLRMSIKKVLEDPGYRGAARRIQNQVQNIPALEDAANIVERVVNNGKRS
jgi:zeaxanthin glucosyltransferase